MRASRPLPKRSSGSGCRAHSSWSSPGGSSDGRTHVFIYGRSYLERERAIPIFLPELELQRGTIPPNPPLDMAGCLRDGTPDVWGRRVAARVGPDIAPVVQTSANGKDILLVQRFDRAKAKGGWTRKAMVSALTMLGLTELQALYASYVDLAQIVRAGFVAPRETLRELFARMVFNILVGNTDDHARNHAALWDGATLTLTPAYDICPQGSKGATARGEPRDGGVRRRSAQLARTFPAVRAVLPAQRHGGAQHHQ